MSSPVFRLQPYNGLCNRIRAIMYWSCFADAIGRDFEIDWRGGEGFDDTAIDELFQIPSCWSVISGHETNSQTTDFLDLNHWLSPQMRDRVTPPHPKEYGLGGHFQYRDVFLKSSEGESFFTYNRIVKEDSMRSVLKNFLRPSKLVQQEIDSVFKRFSGKVIGLHIRMNDAVSNKNENSIYYDTMKGTGKWHEVVMGSEPSVQFFLSTDSEETEREFVSRYGERIIVQDSKDFFRTETWEEKPGQIEALIDLYLLSLTDEIIGTTWSSFSQMAEYLYLTRHSRPLF